MRPLTASNLKYKAIAAHIIPGLFSWIKNNLTGLVREMRWGYLPPLMVYFAAGISGFTGIIESFFVKEALGLSASQLGTKYLNKIFVIERGQYNELGILMITVALIGLTLPIATVVFMNPTNGWAWKNSSRRPRAKSPGYHYPQA